MPNNPYVLPKGIASADGAVVSASQTVNGTESQSGLLAGAAHQQDVNNRLDATGIGADIIPFTGSFIARNTNLSDWFRNRQTVTLEHTTGGSNARRTFTIPNQDALNAAFDVLGGLNIGQVLTLNIGYNGGSSDNINNNALTINTPNPSALFNSQEFPFTIGRGSIGTIRISRVSGSITRWERVRVEESSSVIGAFGDLEFQTSGWNNADGSLLPSGAGVQKGYAFKVFGSKDDSGQLRGGLVSVGVTDKVIYDGDWAVWTADAFTSWGNKDDWFVLSADDVRRISQAAANFLTHIVETDTKVDSGLAENLGAANALVWVSPVIMDTPPFLDPNIDPSNPRANADGFRYVGGKFNRAGNTFQYGANYFGSQLYIGVTPSFVSVHGVENIDIVVRDDGGGEIQRFHLGVDFTQLTSNGFSNGTVNHYILKTSFNYGSLNTVNVVLTRIDQQFTLSSNVDVTSAVSNLGKDQLSSEVSSLLDKIAEFNPDANADTDFSSIIPRISKLVQVQHIEPYVNTKFSNASGGFPSADQLTDVSADNPRFIVQGTEIFIFVEGGTNRQYLVKNITKDESTPLDNQHPNVELGSSLTIDGVSYFGYRVSGLSNNNVLEVDRVTFTTEADWERRITLNEADIARINAQLSHAVLDLPADVVDVLQHRVTVTAEDNPSIVPSQFNTSLSNNGNQAVFYELDDTPASGGIKSSNSINKTAGSAKSRNKLLYIPAINYTNQNYVFADDGSDIIELISFRDGNFYANVFVPAKTAGSSTETLYPAPNNRVSGAGIWHTIPTTTISNGVPVPLADELFFRNNIPASSVLVHTEYRGHANGNLFGASSIDLPANVNAVDFVLDDGGETISSEISRYSADSLRVTATERVNSGGLPTIEDIQVLPSYTETRIVPAIPATVREVQIESLSGVVQVFAFRQAINGNLVIVGSSNEIDTGYSYTTLFGDAEDGHLSSLEVGSTFLDYQNYYPISSSIVSLENSASLPQFGLFTTQYTHETITNLQTQFTVLDDDNITHNVGDELKALLARVAALEA